MAREIKFRVWDKNKKIMLVAFPHSTNLELQNDPYVTMQYTGLRDKNGKEIYEGDIVNQACHTFEVKYGIQGIDAFETIGYNLVSFTKDIDATGERLVSEIEVIGNIYENPELIK